MLLKFQGGGVLACWGASADIIMGNQNSNIMLEGRNSQLGLFKDAKEDMIKIVPYFGYAFCLFSKVSPSGGMTQLVSDHD